MHCAPVVAIEGGGGEGGNGESFEGKVLRGGGEERRRRRGQCEREAEEAARATARKTEATPSAKEVEEHNLGHAVLRSWCPHCVKGRAESYGHVRKVQKESDSPIIAMD